MLIEGAAKYRESVAVGALGALGARHGPESIPPPAPPGPRLRVAPPPALGSASALPYNYYTAHGGQGESLVPPHACGSVYLSLTSRLHICATPAAFAAPYRAGQA
jgi:hypothetical protein